MMTKVTKIGSSSVGIHSHLVKTHSWRKSQLEITVGKFYQLPIFTNWLSQFSNWSGIQNPGYFSNCADFPSENFYQVRFFTKCEFFPSVPIDFQSMISFQVRIFSKCDFFPSVNSFQVCRSNFKVEFLSKWKYFSKSGFFPSVISKWAFLSKWG